jgi:3-oxosteroid 1-dehydrogenase
MFRVGIRMFRNRLGSDLVGMGGALQGRLFEIALRKKIPIWAKAQDARMIIEDKRVCGVSSRRDGRTLRLQARDGVLVDSGGFARNPQMR